MMPLDRALACRGKDAFEDKKAKKEISRLIKAAQKAKRKVGICGQTPSDYPDFAAFLVQQGIDSNSLNPDSVIKVTKRVAEEGKSRQKELGSMERRSQ
jgi:pyruvate,water dikinase